METHSLGNLLHRSSADRYIYAYLSGPNHDISDGSLPSKHNRSAYRRKTFSGIWTPLGISGGDPHGANGGSIGRIWTKLDHVGRVTNSHRR